MTGCRWNNKFFDQGKNKAVFAWEDTCFRYVNIWRPSKCYLFFGSANGDRRMEAQTQRGVGKGLLGKREEFFDCTKSETLMEGVFVYCQK